MTPEFINDFRNTISQAYEGLRKIDEAQAAAKPEADQWSIKELIGHLLDSASNNHQRIVRLQIFDAIEFPFYQQDDFVRINDYQNESWEFLLAFWRLYNLHLLHIIEKVDRTKLENIWLTSDERKLSLAYIIEDYLKHLKHHLSQIAER
ncbi:MAG: DinB family protein [Acidobacteriota bacterium]